jgi:poly(A) polymerase
VTATAHPVVTALRKIRKRERKPGGREKPVRPLTERPPGHGLEASTPLRVRSLVSGSMAASAERPPPSTSSALAELVTAASPALELGKRFSAAGHELHLVGGSVRDASLGRVHKDQDLDLCTDATPDETLSIVRPAAANIWMQGIRFGTVGAEVGGVRMEITTFRTERYEPASRHPEVEFASDVITDLSRRDFTVNAMAVKLPELSWLDPFGGLPDLEAKVLRTPVEPERSFSDDPLRMLRAFRFASQLDFRIDEGALGAIRKLRAELATVSAERIRDELSKLLLGRAPARALALADLVHLTELFLPELAALKLEQDPVHKHKDVLQHTLAVLERAPLDLTVRLAALLHDIGKPRTRRIGPEGVTFHHHEVAGAKMAAQRLKALRYPRAVVDDVEELIRLHHRFHTYRLGWTDSAVRRYVRDAGRLLGLLNDLVRADCTTRNPAKAARLARRMDELEARIAELAAQEELAAIRPDLDGRQIMAYLGVPPGPVVGAAKQFLLELRMEEGPLGEQEAYSRLDAWARSQGIQPAGARVAATQKKSSPP